MYRNRNPESVTTINPLTMPLKIEKMLFCQSYKLSKSGKDNLLIESRDITKWIYENVKKLRIGVMETYQCSNYLKQGLNTITLNNVAQKKVLRCKNVLWTNFLALLIIYLRSKYLFNSLFWRINSLIRLFKNSPIK